MQLLYWFFGNFTTCIPILLISQSLYILTFPLWCPSRKRKFKKTPNQATKQTNKQISPLHSSVFRAAPIILVALGPVVWHAVYRFVQSDPPENVHFDESSVWLKVSGIWILTETPLHYPAAAPSRGDPAEPVPSHVPAGPRWVDAIVGQLKALILPWEVGNLVSIGPQAAPSGHQWSQLSYTNSIRASGCMSVLRGGAISPECRDQSSMSGPLGPARPWVSGSVLLPQCLAWFRDNFARASEGQGWLSTALGFHHAWPSMET